ncbi:MAG: DNA adenine methylase [Phycisphaeraceae bacterium]
MPRPTDVPQPIPYQGSKRQLAPEILRYFPHDIDRLIEPFAGSAAISIAVASRRWATSYWLNDAHTPLIDLWQQIIHTPDDLAKAYEFLWNDQIGREREYFNEVRARFNKTHSPPDFLYLLARCVKAAIRYNANGEFNNTPDNRRRGARPVEMRGRIETASELFRGTTVLTSVDYREVLQDCTSNDLVYMDPPYQGVTGKRDQRYLPTIVHEEFCEALAELNRREVPYAVSYDGRTGDKIYGQPMPRSLNLTHLELVAGRSTQATLLGRADITYEGFYLSPALADTIKMPVTKKQLAMW